MRHKTRLTAGTAFLLVAALAACSDSDADESETLRILVTNDDGVAAEGIDAIVEALAADQRIELVVSAPADNQSGTGDRLSSDPVDAIASTTISGHLATAVDGTPADAVIYGLENLYPEGPPHLLVSGINEGQNVSQQVAGTLSGTVGAAKTAARRGVPALACSQGNPNFDFPAGVAEVVLWIESNRKALLDRVALVTHVTSINIPSCDSGSIRGRVEVPVAPNSAGYFVLGPQDCDSQHADPQTDVEAFFNGFVSISQIGLE